MKAIQYFGKEDLRWVEISEPVLGENEVLLKIKKVGICGTDLHIYHGGLDMPTPLVIGHEFVGEVAKVGPRVTRFKTGQRVVAEHVLGCGVCQFCGEGKKNICPKPTVLGLHRQGALAEYLAVPENLTYSLPEGLNDDAGVLVEPLSIAVYAARKAGIEVGDVVAVVGQGPIGLFVNEVAKADGGIVYGVDVVPARLDYALKRQSVSGVINPSSQDLVTTFQSLSGKIGADVVFEAVGKETTVQAALELARPGGKVMVLGVFEHNVSLNMMRVVRRELQVEGSWTCLNTFQIAIDLLVNGRINTQGFITHRYPFIETKRAFDEASTYSENRIKTVIEL